MPEIVASIEIPETASLVSFKNARKMFEHAILHVNTYRHDEYRRCWANIEKASKSNIDPHWFLREFLWCVYVSGFSAKTISKKYISLLIAHGIEDVVGQYVPMTTADSGKDRLADVFKIFKNQRKAESVQSVRNSIFTDGWDAFHAKYVSPRSPTMLEELPGIGPALSCHLARNLGNKDVCKPDVHLKRVAAHYGFESVEALCKGVSSHSPVGHTDLILWMASIDLGTT